MGLSGRTTNGGEAQSLIVNYIGNHNCEGDRAASRALYKGVYCNQHDSRGGCAPRIYLKLTTRWKPTRHIMFAHQIRVPAQSKGTPFSFGLILTPESLLSSGPSERYLCLSKPINWYGQRCPHLNVRAPTQYIVLGRSAPGYERTTLSWGGIIVL